MIGSTEIRIGIDTVASGFFGSIECFVGKGDDFFTVGYVRGDGWIIGGDADRGGDRSGEGTEAVGKMALFDRCTKFFGDGVGVGTVTFGQDNTEFFPAVASGEVDTSYVVVNDLTDLCQ